MVTQPDDPPLRKLIDNTFMLYAARFILPSLLTITIAIVGWGASTMLNDLKTGQRDGIARLELGQQQQWIQIGKMNETLTATNNVQSGLSVKVEAVKQQVDHLQTQVDGLTNRR